MPLRAIQGAVLSEFERKLSLDALSRIVKGADAQGRSKAGG